MGEDQPGPASSRVRTSHKPAVKVARERRPEQETNTGHGDNTALARVTVNTGPGPHHHHQVYSDHWAVSSECAKIIPVRRVRT